MTLKEALPILSGIAYAKNASDVAQVEFSRGAIQWNASFDRAAHDCELDAFPSSFKVWYLVRIRWEGEDKLLEDPIQKSVVWLADLRRILIMDNLQKQHIILVDRWCMCKRNIESIGHLLLHCEVLVPFGMFL